MKMTREEFDKLIDPAWKKWQSGANCGISDVFWITLSPYLQAERVRPEVDPTTREECNKRIEELHAEIRRVAWIRDGRPTAISNVNK